MAGNQIDAILQVDGNGRFDQMHREQCSQSSQTLDLVGFKERMNSFQKRKRGRLGRDGRRSHEFISDFSLAIELVISAHENSLSLKAGLAPYRGSQLD